MPKNTTSRGKEAEQFAEQFLANAGLTLVTRNFACKLGEIDLIMRCKDTLVFIEVRLRSRGAFAHAAETVTPSKQHKIRKTAAVYLQKHPYNCPCRFDVVAVSLNYNQFSADWIQNAFD